jgi:biopolymer transport protein ExbD
MSESSIFGDSPFESLLPRKATQPDAEFDITAMIDLVFMMNIYFLVTFLGTALGIALPSAEHASPLDGDTAVVLTVVAGVDGKSIKVYLGDGTEGTALLDAEEQEQRVAEYVESAHAEGKTAVLIKAEDRVLLRETGRIARAASIEGMTMHVAVSEKDAAP